MGAVLGITPYQFAKNAILKLIKNFLSKRRKKMNICKFCKKEIHWNYQNGKSIPYDDMCCWYRHNCKKRESE